MTRYRNHACSLFPSTLCALALLSSMGCAPKRVASSSPAETKTSTPSHTPTPPPTVAPPTSPTTDAMAGMGIGMPNFAPSSESIVTLRLRLKTNPNDIKTRIQLAVALDQQGNASEAEDVLRFALQRGQKTAEIFHALGMVYLRSQVYSGAIEAFNLELKRNPKSFTAQLLLGQTYYQLGEGEKALKSFEAALKLDPKVADTYMGLAFLNNSNERYPYAVKYLNEYIRLSKDPGPGYALLSRVYLNMRQYAKSMETGKRATEIMPNSASSWYNLGQAYSYQPGDKSLQEAANAFERTTQLVANWGNAYFELGRVYERMARIDDAIARYREAVRYTPNHGTYRYRLGRILLQKGQKEEGQREISLSQKLILLNQKENQLTQKIKVFPKEPRYLFELGMIYKDLGDHNKAAGSFAAALQLNPKYPKAQEEFNEARRLATQQP